MTSLPWTPPPLSWLVAMSLLQSYKTAILALSTISARQPPCISATCPTLYSLVEPVYIHRALNMVLITSLEHTIQNFLIVRWDII